MRNGAVGAVGVTVKAEADDTSSESVKAVRDVGIFNAKVLDKRHTAKPISAD